MALTGPSEISADLVTTNNAWTNVGAYLIAPGSTAVVRLVAVARKENSGDCALFEQHGLVRRNDTDPLDLIGAITNVISPIKTVGAALWDFRIRTNSDEYIYVDVKGASSADVGWHILGDVQVLTYPVE